MIDSNTFANSGIKLMGLQLFTKFLSSDLKMGKTNEVFQIVGNTPIFNEKLKMRERGVASDDLEERRRK